MYLMHNFYIFVTALFMSLIMVPAIRKWALDTGAIDFPGERRVHNRAVARAGGVAIFIPFLFSVLVYFEMNREVRGILAGSLIIFFTGLIDDLYELTPKQKFVGQIAGCLVAILVGHLYLTHLGNLFGLGGIVLPVWAGAALALFALVGVINALNLIDGLDGLAGGISVISLLAFFWLGFQDKNFTVLALSAGMLGGVVGFLKYNIFPAKIFMGDTGSLVVGFVLGCMSIAMTQGGDTTVKAVVPLIILSVPITDTLVVVLSRSLKGRNPLAPDRTHLHHKIMNLGLGHSVTVLLIYSLTLFTAAVALILRAEKDYYLFGGLLTGTLLLHLLLYSLSKRKKYLQRVFNRFRDHFHVSMPHDFSAQISNALNLLIIICLVVYALTSLSLGAGTLNHVVFAGVSLLGLGGVFLLIPGRFNNRFVYLLILAPVLLISYQIEELGEQLFVFELSMGHLTNALLVLLSVLLALKFMFAKSLDHVLDFSLEIILFSLGLALAVVSPDVDEAFHLSGVISKGIIVFLALKVVTINSHHKVLSSAVAVNLTLLVMGLKLFIG